MSMSFRFTRNILQATLIPSAVSALLALAGPGAHAQLPAVLAYGDRTQLFGYPAATAAAQPIVRDAAGDIFFLSSAPAVYEIPVNGPLQVIVPSNDVSFVSLGAFGTTSSGNVALAVDGAGNLYLSRESNNTGGLIEIPRNTNGTYNYAGETTNTILATAALADGTSGYYQTSALAADAIGNVYVATNGGGSYGIYMEGPSAPSGKLVLSLTSPNYAYSMVVDTLGDIFYADATHVWEIPTAMAQGSTTPTPIQIGSPSTGNCTGCTALTAPKYVSLDASGNLFVGNASNIFAISSTPAFSPTSSTFALPNGTVKTSSFFALGNNGDLFAIYSGALEFYGASKVYIQPIGGTYLSNPIAVGSVSTTTYASPTLAFLFTQAVTLGATPLAVLNYGTANAVAGAAQFTFSSTSGSTTCTANLAIAAGGSCTVELGYAIKDPGPVSGALQLNSASSVLSTVNLTSIGTGSALAIDTGYTTPIGTGYISPSGVALDTTGAMYVADQDANAVYKFAAGSTSATAGTALSLTGLSEPSGVALDAGGNLYVADTGNDRVVVLTAAGTQTTLATTGYALSSPRGVAVDSFGDLYIADTGNARILEVPNPFLTTAGSKPSLITSAVSAPYAIAFDGQNNLFIADKGANAVYEVPGTLLAVPQSVSYVNITAPGVGYTSAPTVTFSAAPTGGTTATGTATISAGGTVTGVTITNPGSGYVATPTLTFGGGGFTTTAAAAPSLSPLNAGSGNLVTITAAGSTISPTTFNGPTGIATDASGTVYIVDSGNKRIVKVPSEGGVYTPADSSVLFGGLNVPFGIASDLTADLYFTDKGAPGLFLATRSAGSGSTAATAAFGTVATSSVGTLTAIASNTGYFTPLTFSSTAAVSTPAAPFADPSNTCTNALVLVAGKTCTVGLTYSPTASGAATGTVTFTDNALAVTTATQKVSLTGYGSGTVAGVSISGPTTAAYGDDATFTVIAKDGSGNTAVSMNGPYTVNITGTATSTASVTLNNGVGSFFLPSLGVGAYNLAVTVNSFTSNTASITLSKAPLYVTATNITRPFDVANLALTSTYSGFANGDTASVLSGVGPTLSTIATRVSPYGNYAITVSGGSLAASNYTIVFVNGVLSVTGSAPQVILFDPLPGFTGGSTVTLTGISTSGLPLTYSTNAGSISGNVLTMPATGTVVTITAKQYGNASYAAATSVTRSFTAQ
jgi:sugar lactone lactonase YvrE